MTSPSLPNNAHYHVSKMTIDILGNEVHKHNITAVTNLQQNYRLFLMSTHDGETGKKKEFVYNRSKKYLA